MKLLDSYDTVEIYDRPGEIPLYNLIAPPLTKETFAIKEKVREMAIMQIDIDPSLIPDVKKRNRIFKDEILKILVERFPKVSDEEMDLIADMVVEEMVGYGRVNPFLEDENLEEIMVVGANYPVYIYHKNYGACETNVVFNSASEIEHIAEKIARDVQRRIDRSSPILDARLPDGSRVNITIPPVALDGTALTIRKFNKDPISIVDLIKFGTLTPELAAFLWICIEGIGFSPSNILVAGGTASGKTSTLNALLVFAPRRERIITIEDTAELYLRHKNRVRLETRPPNIEGTGEIGMDDLLKNALRMRPDRIIVGEVRGPEARTMFVAMNTGHDGCMGTLHANSAHDVLNRLINPPMDVPESMVPALDLVVMQQKHFDREKGVIRRVTEVSELIIGETGAIQENSVYRWHASNDQIRSTGIPSRTQFRLEEAAKLLGTDFKSELKARTKFLEDLTAEGIRNFQDIQVKVNDYIARRRGK
ncbi:MAG: CpaF family protein [Candidatus Hydrothermarchaeales archaeon]